ncbi:ATP-binding cassette domain-containing protein [Sabulilitoribacter arenilitoris]|uniref:ATP-binding cassette domain-containing protein n=1 Tax=Wocania arenilitoris TaxID=2044858 RepID=A0AAE3JMB1_9FLAO|nr:ATP-binding cassette domain-containing protein [Wocania arenilitoris]MCF7569137.1 ATP-binding cassette domain-containing protein [Wocania arenilitoris]
MHKHIALYISNNDDKEQLIKRIISENFIGDFTTLKGAIFSKKTLDKFIDEEVRHGQFNVVTSANNSLLNSSEGERKKALLQHLISQNPEYILVDNVFGNLDIESQKNIEITLTQLSQKTPIIQITNRVEDILPFVNQLYKLKHSIPILCENKDSLIDDKPKDFLLSLPKPYNQTNNQFSSLVKFKNVTICYGSRTIVNGINWEIKPGEFWQLIGPNGSGKSTLLSLISGDNPKAYNQDITLFGIKKGSGESVWDIKRKIGYFSSEYLRGFERLQPIERMIISGFFDSIGLYKIPNERQLTLAHQWLKVLNMFHIKDKSFLSLSVGHQRLVLIARAMVKHPPLLILDEPTNGLDDNDAALFCKLVNKIASESNTAILYVSHRNEAHLINPNYIYQLQPKNTGSIGNIIKSS